MAQDEHPRPQTTLEQMAKLPTVFKKGGTVTAANASVRLHLRIGDLFIPCHPSEHQTNCFNWNMKNIEFIVFEKIHCSNVKRKKRLFLLLAELWGVLWFMFMVLQHWVERIKLKAAFYYSM